MHKHYIHTLLYIHMQPLGGIYPCSQFPAKGLMIQLVTESTHKRPPPSTTHLCRCPSFLRACACILASYSPALLLNTAHSTGHVKWLWKIGNRLPSFSLFLSLFYMFPSLFCILLLPTILSLLFLSSFLFHLLYFHFFLSLSLTTPLLSDFSLSLLVSSSPF